ncbi:MAG: glycoside hydrolase family 2 protein [Chitinophagaceae bacterium]|nr:glycoside hydrolase family 2 protein [Chitinophagaceae bacterium]
MRLLIFTLLFNPCIIFAQNITVELNKNWHFKNQKENKWYKANVPGTVHTDLLANKLIPDPYYRDNESKLQWIDKADWEYKTVFNLEEALFNKSMLELTFDGLDTYADVYLNGKLILQTDNMFRGWAVYVKQFVKRTNNVLLIKFASAQNKVDSIAKSKLPLVLPDNNRVYLRKAQFQFGWDWGPKFVGCGIWKTIKLKGWNGVRISPTFTIEKNNIKLIQQKDSIGTSFYFEKNGKPIYAKGANWIPGDVFLPRLKREDYRKMLLSAKDANMNMLRVWGGGVYESDDFYDLCDSLGIMVWQDFMFAGGMYPGDEAFMNNVREEVKYQIERLRNHPCIVLWCGNNEVEEAWKNWGWQNQFNLHGADSAKVWNDYKRLFQDSLKKWVDEFDGTSPYVSTSPKNGWGHKESFTEGDSHYWGVWWGLEDWEVFENKTGRFVSEYGMQAMPNWNTIKSFTDSSDRFMQSPVIQSHQKASDGFKKLNHYLTRYFIDSAKLSRLSLEDYTYLSQCMQYYILKNSIAVHRSKYPANMGTLLWQLNDCWPVTSWSITDYSRQPKAAWYGVREAYRDDVLPVKDSVYPKDLELEKPKFTITLTPDNIYITSNVSAKYVYIKSINSDVEFSENYFNLEPYKQKIIPVKSNKKFSISDFKIKSLYDILNAQ